MKKNKEYFLKSLKEKTNRPTEECLIINDVLNEHFIIGHNNKDRIKEEFVKRLNITSSEADKLYNLCAELIVKGIFK